MTIKPYRRVAFRGGVLRVLLRAVGVPRRAVQPEDAFYVSYGHRSALPPRVSTFQPPKGGDSV
jgi:hypothetical protein